MKSTWRKWGIFRADQLEKSLHRKRPSELRQPARFDSVLKSECTVQLAQYQDNADSNLQQASMTIIGLRQELYMNEREKENMQTQVQSMQNAMDNQSQSLNRQMHAMQQRFGDQFAELRRHHEHAIQTTQSEYATEGTT